MASSIEYVGPYRLIKFIRSGQSCELWEVNRAETADRLAMKWIPMGASHTREQVNFLKHEYAVGSRMKHPGVITMLDFGSALQGTYLIMELYRGLNLKQHLQNGPESIAHCADNIIRGGAQALGYMHEQGWLHRDIKPDNFLVGSKGKVKLIDFNLAGRVKGTIGQMFAMKSKVQGTVSYISPEQIRGKAYEPTSDIYSFGCTVHEAIAGKAPFTGNSTQDLLMKHLKNRPPTLLLSNPNVTKPFAELIQRTLAKEPADRPATMAAFLEELDGMRIFQKPPQPPAEDPLE